MDFLIAIILWLVGLWILYCVIKSAIDNSETAQNIRTLTNILNDAFPNKVRDSQEVYQVTDIPIDRCPACGAKISERAEVCSSCGLTIVKE